MKKTILTLCAVLSIFAVVTVKAQTTKSSMMLGGGFNISTESRQSNDDYENSQIAFMPSFGYFVADNFAVGANFSISSRTNDNGATKTITTELGVGPFARYYKFTSNDHFAFFGEVNVLFYSGKQDFTPGGESKYGYVLARVSPGFAYFFNNHWALDLSFAGLQYESYDPDKDADDDKINSFYFGVNSLNPTFGVRYHFGGN